MLTTQRAARAQDRRALVIGNVKPVENLESWLARATAPGRFATRR